MSVYHPPQWWTTARRAPRVKADPALSLRSTYRPSRPPAVLATRPSPLEDPRYPVMVCTAAPTASRNQGRQQGPWPRGAYPHGTRVRLTSSLVFESSFGDTTPLHHT